MSVEVLMRLLELAEPNLVFPAAAEDVKSHRNSSFQGSQQFSKGFFVVVVGASQPGCVVDNRRWRVALGGWARGLGPQIFTQCFCVAGEFLHHMQNFLVYHAVFARFLFLTLHFWEEIPVRASFVRFGAQ